MKRNLITLILLIVFLIVNPTLVQAQSFTAISDTLPDVAFSDMEAATISGC